LVTPNHYNNILRKRSHRICW